MTEKQRERLGLLVRALRSTTRPLTQAEIARITGMTRQDVSRLLQYAERFGIHLAQDDYGRISLIAVKPLVQGVS